jgi:hypothetical protein
MMGTMSTLWPYDGTGRGQVGQPDRRSLRAAIFKPRQIRPWRVQERSQRGVAFR